MENVHSFAKTDIDAYYLMQNVFDNLSVGLELYDQNGILTDMNRVEMELMGVKDKKEVIGLCIYENPNISEDLKKRLRAGENVNYVVEYDFGQAQDYFPTRKTGKIYLEIDLSVLRNESGEIVRYLVVSQDITERILWQRKYEALYNQNLAILEALPVGVEVYDVEGRLIYINDADGQIFGVDKNLPVVENINIYSNPNLPERVKEAVRNKTKVLARFPYIFSAVKEEKYYNTFIHEDTVRQIECNGTPVFNADGELENYVFIVKDITESVEAEEKILAGKQEVEIAMETLSRKNAELEKRKELQDKILDSMPLPIHIKDVEDNFRYVFCNEESKRMFGSAVQSTAYEVMNKSQADKIHETDRQVYVTGKPYFGQEKIVLEDGRSYETIVQKSIIEDDGKRLLLNVRWDKSLQNELERRAKVLSISLDALNAYTWRYDIENDLMTYGDGFERIGRDPESLNTLDKFMACIHPDDKQMFIDVLHSTLENETEEVSIEYRIDLNGDQHYTWWERRGALEIIMIDDIPTRHVFGMDINIENHKNTELTLLKNKAEMTNLIRQNELVLNNTNSGLAYISTDYIVQWENVTVCSTSLSYEAYKKGEPCYKSAHNRNKPCENCVLQRAIKSRQVEQITFSFSNQRTVEVFATPVFNASDEVEGIVIRVDDITERQQMIADLDKARRQAEQSDKLKSAFLANMSHEIRTPLNAIVGFSDLMMTTESEEEREEYMQIINTNNELLLKLINDILDLSKIEAGSVELKYEEFDLSGYFEDLYASMQRRVTNPSVRLLAINPYKHCMVKLDRNRLAQIVTNYVTNAIKYTPKGFIEMGYEEVDEGIRIYVRDTGIGIPEEKKSKVFHRFEKLDEFAQGTGLGLSICKAIVEACGGSVGFETEFNQGSLFWAIMPCSVEINDANSTSSSEGKKSMDAVEQNIGEDKDAEEQEKKTILVVEDIQSNFLLVSALLKKYNLLHAANGKEAVEIVRTQPVDMVLMDMKMPVMDGLTATKEIRKFNKQTPIVALTAHAFESDQIAALEAGCNDYLVKPINRVKVMQTLRKYDC